MVRVAENGGFTAAAAGTGLTPSAVAKLIGRLEQRLGVRLLHRTTRRVTLTAEGERYVERARRILADIEECEADLTAQGAAPRGLLRVAAGNYRTLVEALPEFHARYPEIELEIMISSRRIDLIDDRIDVALRLGRLADSSFVSRRVGRFPRVICATPEYLAKAPPLERPDDLVHHNCLYAAAYPALRFWPFRDRITGGTRVIEVASRVRLDDAEANYRAGLAGLGIIRMTMEFTHHDLAAGRLVSLLEEDHIADPVDFTALMPLGRQHSPKVRAFVDFVAEICERAGWR